MAGGLLAPSIASGGYAVVHLRREGRGGTQTVHRLVCRAFHGPPPTPKHEACHRFGPGDNHATSLRWDTHAENMRDIHRAVAPGAPATVEPVPAEWTLDLHW